MKDGKEENFIQIEKTNLNSFFFPHRSSLNASKDIFIGIRHVQESIFVLMLLVDRAQ
jgi:hypothetical protein